MFGGAGGGGPRGPRKADDTTSTIKASLEDLYVGKTVKVAVTRTVFDKDPSGK